MWRAGAAGPIIRRDMSAAPPPPGPRRDRRFAAALALAAFSVGSVYTATWGGTAHFFQELFGPAAMFACGRGWVNPVLDDAPDLRAFLHPPMHVDHPPVIDACPCDAIPAELATQPWESFQRRQRYLIYAAGWVWWWTAPSWSALAPLHGLLHAAAALALYVIFRFAAGPWGAAAATWLMICSPIQLHHLPRLRDYSKAPFLLGGIALLAWIVARADTPRRLLGGALALGLLAGVGVGFRMDVVMLLPAALAAIALFPPPGAGGVRHRLAAAALCLAAYYGVSWPVTRALETGMKYQDFLLGLNDLYDSRLGVGGAPYQIGHRYLDREPIAILQAYAPHRHGEIRHYAFDTVAYEAIGRDYTLRLAATIPADLQLRAGAAILRTLDELTFSTRHAVPRGVTGAMPRAYFEAQSALAAPALRFARYAAALALLILAARDPRIGLAALFLFAYFGGYGAIQFASRHYFHMQFLGLWATLFVVWSAARWRPGAGPTRAHFARAACFGIAVATAWFGALWGLRAWQAAQLAPLRDTVAQGPWEPVSLRATPAEDGTALLQGNGSGGLDALPTDAPMPWFDHEYLMIEIVPGPEGVEPVFEYAGSIPDFALTWSVALPPGNDPVRIAFPAYHARWLATDDGWTHYRGVRLPADAASRARLYRLPAPEALPFLFTWRLPVDAPGEPLHQRLTR